MHDQTPEAQDAPTPIAPFLGHRTRPSRERLLEAVLLVSGERGYEQIAVQDVIERGEASRATFYKYFSDKEDCFVQAYTDASEWLYRRLISAAKRQPGWREGLRTSLAELLEFCANQPLLSRALFLEPHAAGGKALAQHDKLIERLAEAIDSARSEIDTRRAPPPVTASFMVGAIETLLRAKLMSDEPRRMPEMLPGLLHFVVMQYFGEDAAWAELTATPLSAHKARREAAGHGS